MRKLLLIVALTALLLPDVASAQDDFGSGVSAVSADTHVDDLKIAGWFQVAAGGTVESGGASEELDATVGLGGRLEIPVMEWLALGGLFNMSFWKGSFQNDRNAWFDFDVMVKGFYGFAVGGFGFEAYAYIPLGITIATIDAPNIDAGFGFNVGLVFGATWYFIEDLGLMLEMGWLHHLSHHSDDFTGIDYSPVANQFVMNFGVAMPF